MTITYSETDPWPEPDEATIEKAALAVAEARGYHNHGDPADRGVLGAVADDPLFQQIVAIIWADRLPTPHAYLRAASSSQRHYSAVSTARGRLAAWAKHRDYAPAGSDFARLYDDLHSVLNPEGKR